MVFLGGPTVLLLPVINFPMEVSWWLRIRTRITSLIMYNTGLEYNITSEVAVKFEKHSSFGQVTWHQHLSRNQMCTCPRLIKFICAIIICSSLGRVSSDSHLSDRAKIMFRTIGRPFPRDLCTLTHCGLVTPIWYCRYKPALVLIMACCLRDVLFKINWNSHQCISDSKVNTMAADALATCIARPSAAMISTMQDWWAQFRYNNLKG